jgi:hypothetical protein
VRDSGLIPEISARKVHRRLSTGKLMGECAEIDSSSPVKENTNTGALTQFRPNILYRCRIRSEIGLREAHSWLRNRVRFESGTVENSESKSISHWLRAKAGTSTGVLANSMALAPEDNSSEVMNKM